MTNNQPQNPLHGITLEMILTQLAAQYSWEELGQRIPIKCFTDNPSIKSSLKFLRRTPWARKKVEELYNTHGHKLRFPPSEKAQFVTECGIHKVYSMTFPTKKNYRSLARSSSHTRIPPRRKLTLPALTFSAPEDTRIQSCV